MIRKHIHISFLPAHQHPGPLMGYLASRYDYLTEEGWRNEIAHGRVSVNNRVEYSPNFVLRAKDKLAWNSGHIVEPAVDDRVTILYQEAQFAVVDKPGNLPVHPAGRYFDHTLTMILERRLNRSVYAVQRLDRETSGAMLVAFDGKTAALLSAALAGATKEYLALVHGVFPQGEMLVDWPLGADESSAVRKKRRAWSGGTEKALTRFERVSSNGALSLVRCFPQTGRLHQIRAHLLAAGFPVVGDKLYGRDERLFLRFIETGWTPELAEKLLLPRQALHARRLRFSHPQTGREIHCEAPVPECFADLLPRR